MGELPERRDAVDVYANSTDTGRNRQVHRGVAPGEAR